MSSSGSWKTTKDINFGSKEIEIRVRTEAGLGCGGSQGLRDWDNRIPFPWELGKER